ncbi:hypothetical protein BEP19_04475 [Ammoniphilus oxalaticus]|uniref:Uncharacterized protein n=1 Tax=Ammoniphilus oxalaticus TaxID=66863 RepID=A0A419SLZ0_9BACL|nr:hypothetical protein BEP19_04475 [Ammoniphilus oxalaticus]
MWLREENEKDGEHSMELQQLKAEQLELLYRTEKKTKWLLKFRDPEQSVNIYMTRPANETSGTLLHTIKCYKNLNDWFKKHERLF